MFPTKQRETWPSEGTLGNIIHIVHTRTRNPKPPRAEAARRGAGRQALLENRHRFMYSYIQHNFLSTTERGSPAGKTDPRQTDSFCIRHQRGHGYRNLKKRGPYIDGPFTLSPALHPSLSSHHYSQAWPRASGTTPPRGAQSGRKEDQRVPFIRS